jgi:hypothetical protein
MLAVSTLHVSLHKQNNGMMNLHLLMMFSVNNYFHSKIEMNSNEYIIYTISISKIKYIIILILNILQ